MLGRKSILTSEGEVWKRQRHAFSAAFSFAFLKSLVPRFASHAGELCAKLGAAADAGTTVALHAEATLLTLDIILDVAMSKRFGMQAAGISHPFVERFSEIQKDATFYSENMHVSWLRFLPWRARKTAALVAGFDSQLMPIIAERVAALAKEPARQQQQQQQDDILGMAIAMGDGRLDEEEIMSQMKTFLFAGHDTTASTIAWAVYELARHPSAEARLAAELAAELGGRDPASADDLSRLKFLGCVIKETLR